MQKSIPDEKDELRKWNEENGFLCNPHLDLTQWGLSLMSSQARRERGKCNVCAGLEDVEKFVLQFKK